MRESTGLVTATVRVLQKYGNVHIDLIAKELHHKPEEITSVLRSLERKGLLVRNGEMVHLRQEETVDTPRQ